MRYKFGTLATGAFVLGMTLLTSAFGGSSSQVVGEPIVIADAAAGSVSGKSGSSAWNAVVSKAKEEGKLLIFNGQGAYPVLDDLIAGFEKESGIKVSVITGRISDMETRIDAEGSAGKVTGDLVLTSYCGAVDSNVRKYYAARNPDTPNAARLADDVADAYKSTQIGVPLARGFFVILANDQLAPKGSITSWKGLSDPKWKGKMIANAPWTGGAGNVWFQVTYADPNLGPDYQKAMAAQQSIVSRDNVQRIRQVAQGQFAITYPFNFFLTPTLKNLPVYVVVPTEGVPYIYIWAVKIKGGPHPAATDVFSNYLLSRDAQNIIVSHYQGGVTKDAARTEYEGKIFKPMKLRNCEERSSSMKVASQIYGQR